MITLRDVRKKTLGMIEELNPDSEHLTDDPDIAAKFNDVTNQVMFELTRMKKIPKYVEMDVTEGDTVTFLDIEEACGRAVYQLGTVCGVRYDLKASGTVLKIRESGTAQIDVFVYPVRITDTTDDSYEFELSQDIVEIMPYGIAADLLKSDVSAEYGKVYEARYETMLNRLDPRHSMVSITFEGGVNI